MPSCTRSSSRQPLRSESTKDPGVRQKALEHLSAPKAEEDADNLEKVATEFYRRFGRFPASLEDLVATGILPGFPVDPAGYPYVFGAGGKVLLNPSSPIHSDSLRPTTPR